MVRMLCVTEGVGVCTSLVSGFPGGSEIQTLICTVVWMYVFCYVEN
jgi:hypothetical protein